MKQIWKSLLVVMVLTMAFGITSQAAVKSISITKPTKKDTYAITLDQKNPTKTVKLTWKASTSGKKNNTVNVKSSNSKVVAVKKDSNTAATLTAKKAGTATITVSSGKVKDTIKITVKQNVTSITPKNEYVFIKKGKTATIKATIAPKSATDKTVTYKSSKSSVAAVDKKGKITAKKVGTATITIKAKAGGATAKVYVTVGSAKSKVTKVTATAADTTLYPGETTQITAKVAPDKATNKKVHYESSNEAVATVSDTGKVKAVKAGTAKITVTASDGSKKSDTVTIKVNAYVEKITLNRSAVTLATSTELGDATSVALAASVAPSTAANKTIRYASSNKAVAEVNSKGVVTAKGAGTAVITASAVDGSKVSASCTVTVKAYSKKSVTITPSKLTVPYETKVKIAWNNVSGVLKDVNTLLGYGGGITNRTMKLEGRPYTLSYDGALSLKNQDGQECLTKLLNGTYTVNGTVQLAESINVAEFNTKLNQLEAQLGMVKPNMSFGSGTITVNDKAYLFTDVKLNGKTCTFKMNGARVSATLNSGKLAVVSDGSLDEAMQALNAVFGNVFVG